MGVSGIDEKVCDAWVWVNMVEAGRVFRKAASRGSICWVDGTRDVLGEESAVGFLSEVM
jgi:hypothetical protein